MAVIESWVRCDLKKPVQVQMLGGNLFSMDNQGNKIGVEVFDNGETATLGGTVSANVIRADGATVAVSGTLSGNKAYVVLPQTAYAVPGFITIVIKLTSSGVITTLAAVTGIVYRSSTDATVDPGTVIPSIETLIADIEAAVATIPADYSSLWTSLAPAFSSSISYKAGQYVTYDGKVYRFMVDHDAGSWNANHAAPVNDGEGIANSHSAVSAVSGNTPIFMIPGKYISLSGSSVTMADGVPSFTGASSAGYAVGIMPCSEGDVFTINGHGGSSTRLWGFINSSGTILSAAAATITRTGLTVTAPANSAYIIVHTNDGRVSFKGYAYAKNWEYNTVEIIDYLPKTSGTSSTVTFTWTGNSCVVNGTPSGNAWNFLVYYATDPTPELIVPGGKYHIEFTEGGGGNVAFALVWFDSNNTVIRRDYLYNSQDITAPDNFETVSIALAVFKGHTANNEEITCRMFTVSGETRVISDDMDEVRAVLKDYIPRNVLLDFGNFHDSTSHTVTYTWNSDHETCIVNGTADSADSFNYLWIYNNGLPEEIKPGKQYDLIYAASESNKVGVNIYYLLPEDQVTRIRYLESTRITIPNDCIGISIRLDTTVNTVCDNVSVNVKLNTIAAEQIDTGAANHVAKMFSIGSSFMTGWIYKHDEQTGTAKFDHQCSYDNSPYGNVAISLGIEQANVNHILMESTGFLQVVYQSKGNILDRLLDTDLSPYDYILTQINRPDLGVSSGQGFPLGDLSSAASKTTIVGGVKTLLNYMKSNAPNANLILVGPPPSDPRSGYRGANVFTAEYLNGSSIGEVNEMLHRLAVQEHFIYIDWEDLMLSYFYYTLCDDGNVHPRDDATIRAMGLYLARNCNYGTSLAKVLKAGMNN